MGYYTGNGVVVSGGQSTSVFFHFAWNGAHNVLQKCVSETKKLSGVSLQRAQGTSCSNSLATKQLFNNARTLNCWSANCSGVKEDANYSQIGESNLYELTVVKNTFTAKLDDGEWQ